MNVKYSILVPVYNSNETLTVLTDNIISVFGALNETFELIFIDDGSESTTWQTLKNLKEKHPTQIKVIGLTKNYGQHNAVFCGMNFAKGDFIVTIDDDLQIDPADIKLLIEKQTSTGADVVYGDFVKKQHSTYRKAGSWYIKKMGGVVSNASDKGSSFRLIKKGIVEKLISHSNTFIYIDELILWYTTNIVYQEVNHYKQAKSRYSFIKLVKLTFNITYFYTTVPLKLMIFGGVFAAIVCFLIGVYFIYKKLVYNVPLGYTSLIVTITFSTAIILICIGIIGEYLKRIIAAQNKKPPFAIKEIL